MAKSLISRTKDTCGGSTRIAGTRITTSLMKTYYTGGETVENIAKMYGFTEEQVKAAINFGRKNKI